MYNLSKFAARTGRIGRPLPDLYPVLKRNKIQFRHGATSMLAGRPGTYKTVIALNLMYGWAKTGMEILYFCADSDEATVAKRVSSIATGDSADVVEKSFNTNNVGRYETALQPIDGVRFVYRQLDMEGIANQVFTFEAVYGDFPDVIFVDNLIDFVPRPDDWGGMLLLTKELKELARETKSHICILHHAKIDGDKDKGTPPKEWEIQGKITQIPETVITVGSRMGIVTLDCVKNRNGPDDTGWLHFRVSDNFRLTDTTESLQAKMS